MKKGKGGTWRARGKGIRKEVEELERYGEDMECKQEVVEWGEGGVLL